MSSDVAGRYEDVRDLTDGHSAGGPRTKNSFSEKRQRVKQCFQIVADLWSINAISLFVFHPNVLVPVPEHTHSFQISAFKFIHISNMTGGCSSLQDKIIEGKA